MTTSVLHAGKKNIPRVKLMRKEVFESRDRMFLQPPRALPTATAIVYVGFAKDNAGSLKKLSRSRVFANGKNIVIHYVREEIRRAGGALRDFGRSEREKIGPQTENSEETRSP